MGDDEDGSAISAAAAALVAASAASATLPTGGSKNKSSNEIASKNSAMDAGEDEDEDTGPAAVRRCTHRRVIETQTGDGDGSNGIGNGNGNGNETNSADFSQTLTRSLRAADAAASSRQPALSRRAQAALFGAADTVTLSAFALPSSSSSSSSSSSAHQAFSRMARADIVSAAAEADAEHAASHLFGGGSLQLVAALPCLVCARLVEEPVCVRVCACVIGCEWMYWLEYEP
jgi:hypothetical protein